MKLATALDGAKIAYHTFGRENAEPMLMLQGLGADSRGWALQRNSFGRRFRCITIDNRGVGGTAGVHPESLEQMAADAAAVLDAEEIESAHVMGASMGGAIAQYFAVGHSERVRSLVLACTACRHHEWRRELLKEWADAVLERGMGALASDGLQWLVDPRLHRRFGLWLNLMARLLLQAAPEAFAAQVEAILRAPDEMRYELTKVDVPTLVITGSQDLLTPLGDAEELAELLPLAQLEEVRGAGHALMVLAPIGYNRAVHEFLNDITTSTQLAS